MIQVIGRALTILDFIADNPEKPQGITAIAGHSGLNKGTCANIVKSLCEQNLLERTPTGRGYVLGPRLYHLVRHGPYRNDLVRVVKPVLLQLVTDVQETTLVATIQQGKRSVLFQVNGNRAINIQGNILLEDIYKTATGRLLLAYAAPDEREAVIARHGLPDGRVWKEANTRRRLEEALSRIEGDGKVVHRTEHDVTGIAFPLKENARVIAALGLFLPAFRFAGRHRKLVMEKMAAAAKTIDRALDNRFPSVRALPAREITKRSRI